jgi:hypothetical protein
MDNIQLAGFAMRRQGRVAASGKLKGVVCVSLLTTAGAQSLILRKSRGSARLSQNTS